MTSPCGHGAARPGRVAQIGLMIALPDGTASYATQFLANWWRLNGTKETKMATHIGAFAAGTMVVTVSR